MYLTCPHCQTPIQRTAALAGKVAACPTCKRPMKMPPLPPPPPAVQHNEPTQQPQVIVVSQPTYQPERRSNPVLAAIWGILATIVTIALGIGGVLLMQEAQMWNAKRHLNDMLTPSPEVKAKNRQYQVERVAFIESQISTKKAELADLQTQLASTNQKAQEAELPALKRLAEMIADGIESSIKSINEDIERLAKERDYLREELSQQP